MKFASSDVIRSIDRYCIDKIGISELILMENAALKIIKNIDLKNNKSFTIICGSGNNGGDGLAVGRHLVALGKDVKVFLVGTIDKMSESCKANYTILKNIGVKIINVVSSEDIELLKNAVIDSNITIDALLGTGITREVKGMHTLVISVINENSNYILAIDVPSGLDSNNGYKMGNCVVSNKTVTLGLYKSGFLNYDSEKYTGQVIVEKIGIPKFVEDKYHEGNFIADRDMFKKYVLPRNKYSHKGDYGRVLIFAGSKNYTGAAYICTEAVVKSGAGLITLCCEEDILPILKSKLVEAMTISNKDSEGIDKLLNNSNCIAVGPGMGNNVNTLKVVESILKIVHCPVVLDADAINVLSNNLILLKNAKVPVVLTPHLGEMARLTGFSIDYIKENKMEVARDFAKDYNIILLLKGYNTIITDGNITVVNSTGNSSMASGGMGDCLTGIITSFIAQGQKPMTAAITGAFLHGYCGEILSREMFNVSATDILNKIPYMIKELQN
ncbi:NAD(P)H-hydrate dehydratase [Clostridium arbusti]|uniref:NAD(P)H-hydrate dehydratase n=1 Tax=Clostridium arbusti TaxID=1137848 RepID=UPI0002880ABD|nr:NAD(P)H-hydrate dehydratase [Clostridium arbusti]